MCFSDFITIDRTTPSKSGLYFVDLLGMTVAQLEGLTKDEQSDFEAFFENMYANAQKHLEIDLQKELAQRFHIDKKLVSRETSAFLDEVNGETGLAGVKIEFNLPKYAQIKILTIGVISDQAEVSPEAQFFVYDDAEDGELLSTVTATLTSGKNTVSVYESFEEDELFIAYNPELLSLRATENKYYPDASYAENDLFCTFPCYWGEQASVRQINGGGLNVKFIVTCSMEKFICENLPLFQYALWYRIAVETMKEGIVSDRVTRFTVLSEERATEKLNIYLEDYNKALTASAMNIKMQEDPICFSCKKPIYAVTSLP